MENDFFITFIKAMDELKSGKCNVVLVKIPNKNVYMTFHKNGTYTFDATTNKNKSGT